MNAQTIASKAKSAIGETVDKLSGMMGLGAKPKRGRRRRSAAARVKTGAKRAVLRSKTARRKTPQIKRRVRSAAKKAASRTRRAIRRR